LPADLIDEIVERTDGVPLFLEEVTKVVIETAAGSDAAARGTLAAIPGARLAVPATLQASLMARLDRLGPVPKEIAQVGAAIGREFSYELLSAVASRGEAETQAALARLVAAGLVFQPARRPRRNINSSTPWFRTLLTARFCAGHARDCTPGLPMSSRAAFPRSQIPSRRSLRTITRRRDCLRTRRSIGNGPASGLCNAPPIWKPKII
jgi:hypothetical protein